MNNMGQTSTEQWAPPWSQVKVYGGKESVGMEYTMVETYFDSMYPMKSGDVNSVQSFTKSKVTPDNSLFINSISISSEKRGFEVEVRMTPPENNNNNNSYSHKTAGTVKRNIPDEKSSNGMHYIQEVQFPSPLPECIIKEEPVTVLDVVE
jgi:hypothetical protein